MKLQLALKLGLGRPRVRGGESPDMILVYEIPSAGTPIQLAIQANSTYFPDGQAVVISWGDGSAKETVSAASDHTGYVGHTYTSVGTYTVKISGSMKMYGRSNFVNIAGQELLTRIDSFGKLGITSFAFAFRGCTGLTSVPKTLPSGVTNTSYMFYYCIGAAFNPDMKSWTLKTGVNTEAMFTASRIRPTTWLDKLLIAWAANPAQGNNITIDFSPNKFTVDDGGEPLPDVADALAILEEKGWTITTANPYSST